MASGMGAWGTTSRCFFHFQDLAQCIKDTGVPTQCTELNKDYFECLHNSKALERRKAIKEQYKLNQLLEKEGGSAHAAGGHGGGHH